MKNRIIGLILCVCLCATLLTGCSLYRKNTDAKNNAIAVKVGDEIITREDVQTMYTSLYYGSNAIYRYLYTEEELTQLVVNSLVNNKVALQEAKKLVTVTEDDFDEIVADIKSVILDEIDERESEYIKANGDNIPERLCDGKDCTDPTHHHEEDTSVDPLDVYESVIVTPSVVGEQITEDKKAEKVENLIAEIKADCAAFETRQNVFNEYLAELVQAEVIDGKVSGKETALKNKIDELVDYNYDQKFVLNLEEYINSRIEITDDEVVAKFEELLRAEQEKYADGSFVKTFEGATDGTYLYMGYPSTNEGYFHVEHILLQFTKEDLAILKTLTGYGVGEDGVSADEWVAYVAARNSFVNNIIASYKTIDGKTATDGSGSELKITAADLVVSVNEIIDDTTLTDEQKAIEFRKLMYMYGQDPGMKTKNIFGYTFTANRDDLKDSSVDSKNFVDEFIDKAYELYGSISASGDVAISDNYIVTDNGIHILMAYGKTKRGAICDANAIAMKNTMISSAYGQSVYEYVYAKLLEEKKKSVYGDFIDAAKENYKIEYKLTTYKELFK